MCYFLRLKAMFFIIACFLFIASWFFAIGSPRSRRNDFIDESGNWKNTVNVECTSQFIDKFKKSVYCEIESREIIKKHSDNSEMCMLLAFVSLFMVVIIQAVQINNLNKSIPPLIKL